MKAPVQNLLALSVFLAAATGGMLWLQDSQPRRWGIDIDYHVDIKDALRDRAEETAARLLSSPPWGAADCAVTPTGPKIVVVCPNEVKLATAPGDYAVHVVAPGAFELRLPQRVVEQFREDAVLQAVWAIERRLDALNLSVVQVRRTGPESIAVFMPGIRASAQSEDRATRANRLRFQIVDRDGSQAFFAKVAARAATLADWPATLDPTLKRHPVVATKAGVRSTSRELLQYLVAGQSDLLHRVGFEEITVDPHDRDLRSIHTLLASQTELHSTQKSPDLDASVTRAYRLVYVFRLRGMDAMNLESSEVGFDDRNRPVVHMRFNESAAADFFALTRDNTNELMAIMLDDRVISAPNIRQPIVGGRVQIEMGRTGEQAMQDAGELVGALKVGHMMAPLRKVGERDAEEPDL